MKPLAITLGDPAGIGPEVVEKALASLDVPVRLFGTTRSPVRYGEISAEYGRVALAAIDDALDAIARGECSALVTAPIHKQAIALAGATVPGHTELLAARAGLARYAHDYAMYFDSPSLRTVLLSVHVPLREAITTIDADAIAALARLTTRDYAKLYGAAPRIAVAGINPHAGEGGRFGDEEQLVARGVALAQRDGLSVTGPHPPDTVFLGATRGRYDVVMAMYHDQGLIPVKTLAFEQSVNVTLGLPYLRASVDHGTAFDIAGKGIADAAPMAYAIRWAAEHAERFAR
ncbi:MAG: 4-hydroxythreonine-4-phosphate dehydrogenase PdxA [Acidobacteria bacterium]|nr:4-hydroxythreonine-4-phosphate dehydrogenase PdxA [Acidobacteriota bacterium]MBV9476459.1 4-hydroxythreonine-4-phosphate dehydrogenase PdxA [Acidobacteriota bacterium]